MPNCQRSGEYYQKVRFCIRAGCRVGRVFEIRQIYSWFWNTELTTDPARSVVVDLPVTRDRTLSAVCWVDPYGMTPTFAQKPAAVRYEMAEQILSLHGATTPAGTSSTAELARK
jgi:hypothetical protein